MASAPLVHPGDVVRVRGDRWTIARQVTYGTCALIEARGCDQANRAEVARFILPAESIERIPARHRPHVVRPARWRHLARALLGRATPLPTSLLTATRARFEILPFQLEPALAITRGVGCRVLIADEVGLGKTIQASLIVAELLERAVDGRALIVTPAGLREQWQLELERLFDLRATIVDSAALVELSVSAGDSNPWAANAIVITSIDFIKRPEVIRSVEALVWEAVVFDEAHALAGPSDRSTAAAALACRARNVVLLTATPHAGDDAAFDRLCGIGDIDGEFPLMLFRRTRADATVRGSRDTTWLRVRPTEAERRMHRALAEYARAVWRASAAVPPRLAMSVLARRAASSAASLAISVERRLALLSAHSPPGAQLTLPIFDPVSDDDHPDALLATPGLPDADREREWLMRLLGLARTASAAETKLRALKRLVRRARTPVLVFTEYRDTLERLSTQLGSVMAHLHGGLTNAERQESTRRFTEGDVPVMLATDAASEGLNLQQRCHVVVNLELPWSPVRLEQRVGRVDRIGQRSRVHALHFVARGTIEEQIAQRLLRRAEHAHAALEQAPLSEMEIAAHVLGSRATAPAPPHPRDAAASRVTILRPDLRGLAAAEAARLVTSRTLLKQAADPTFERPQLTCIRGRTTRTRRLWAFRVRFGSDDGDLYWAALFGVEAGVSGRYRPAAALVSEMLATGDIEREMIQATADLDERVRAGLAPIISLAARRERAIAQSISTQHARLAATLVERSLFDRRTDRAAASQEKLTREALQRCTARIQQVERLASIAARHPELAFAIVLA